MSSVRESYQPYPMAANTAITVPQIGGFLCTVSGTVDIISAGTGTAVVTALPVTAGFYTPIPMLAHSSEGFKITLSGGAAGTLMR